MKRFTDKVAAVTGAGSGIGRALALRLADERCHLALSDIDSDGLVETARLCEGKGVKISTTVLDVADREAVEAWAEEVVEIHGQVNLVFNNAGVAMAGSVEGTAVDDVEWLMGINFWGVVYGTKAFLPHLRAAGEGHIVNISSIFGIFSSPTQSAYNASKFAVRGFTESLRQELDAAGDGVSCTTVHPGGIRTNIAKSARMDRSADTLLKGDGEAARAGFEKLLRTTPDQAAKAILDGVRKDARRVLIGHDARVADVLQRVLPTGYQVVVRRALRLLS